MMCVLVLGSTGNRPAVPDGARPFLRSCRIVSLSPRLSEMLADADVPHRCAAELAPASNWTDLQREADRTLRLLCAAPPAHAAFLDDWSHYLVDELREQLFWLRVAEAILATEQPSVILVQQTGTPGAAHGPLTAMAAAFDALERPWSAWEWSSVA